MGGSRGCAHIRVISPYLGFLRAARVRTPDQNGVKVRNVGIKVFLVLMGDGSLHRKRCQLHVTRHMPLNKTCMSSLHNYLDFLLIKCGAIVFLNMVHVTSAQ